MTDHISNTVPESVFYCHYKIATFFLICYFFFAYFPLFPEHYLKELALASSIILMSDLSLQSYSSESSAWIFAKLCYPSSPLNFTVFNTDLLSCGKEIRT